MDYKVFVEKFRQMAEKEGDLGNPDAAAALTNEAEKLQVWFDGGQLGPCPVDLGKYDLAAEPKAAPVEKAAPAIEAAVPKKMPEKIETQPEVTPEIRKEEAERELAAIAEDVESPEQAELRRQLDQARQFFDDKQLREAVALATQVENRSQDAALKENAGHLLAQARRQLGVAVQKALVEGDAARNAGKIEEARKHYEIVRQFDPENDHARRALLELGGALVDQLSEADINSLRAGLKNRIYLESLGEAVHKAEAREAEGKLTPQLTVLLKGIDPKIALDTDGKPSLQLINTIRDLDLIKISDAQVQTGQIPGLDDLLEGARAAYNRICEEHGKEATMARFGSLAVRAEAVAKIRARVARGERVIKDPTTNTEKPAFEFLREAEILLEHASEDTAQYEVDLADKFKSTSPRYVKKRLETALQQPFSEKYVRLLKEKVDEVNVLIGVQEKAETLLDQAQKERDFVKVYQLVLQAQQIFPHIPGIVEQAAYARKIALPTFIAEVGNRYRNAESDLKYGKYQQARSKIVDAEKLVISWPEEEKPAELKSLLGNIQELRQRIDTTENEWDEYSKLAKTIREQVPDPARRAEALDLFRREVSADKRFKAFPDLKDLTSEIDNYKGVGEQLTDAQSARTEGDWSRVYEIADKVIKSAKAGQLAEKFNELHAEASIELAISRAKSLLDDDDVPEANNILSAALNKERGTPREAVLRQRLEPELKKIAQCIADNAPMQSLFGRASDLVGLRDAMLFKAYANPTYALRQARINVDGQATNPEMRDLINRLKTDPNGPDPIAQELSERAGDALKAELGKKGFAERLEAMHLFRYVGGNAQERQPGWLEFRLSLRTAEARRAERLVSESLRQDILEALKKAYASRREKALEDDTLHDLAARARGLREAGLLETDEDKAAGWWLEIEWGKRQAQAGEARGDWNGVVSIWKRLLDLHGTPEVQNGWRSARIQQAVERARDLVYNHHQGEDALAVLREVQAEAGVGSAWELHLALADTHAVLGNFDSAFGCLAEAGQFSPRKAVQTAVQKKHKELEREKLIQQAVADAQSKKDHSPYEALLILQNALGTPSAKDSRRLRESRDEIFAKASESLLRTAKEAQATGGDEGKIKAVVALVDLQGLEGLAGVPTNRRHSTNELGRLRSDLASVARSVVLNAGEFNPASMILEQAISHAGVLSGRLQVFDAIMPLFGAELEMVKDQLVKRRHEISRTLGNLQNLQKYLGEALNASLWEEALQTNNFQTLDQYALRLGQLDLGSMQEVQSFEKRLAEWKEIRKYLAGEIKEIKDKFIKEEAFGDIKTRLRQLAGMPGLRSNGQPWQMLQQRDYDEIRQLMSQQLHIIDVYGNGELDGWDAVEEACEERQQELELWQAWEKQCAFKMDEAERAFIITQSHTADIPLRPKLRDWETAMISAQAAIDALVAGPQYEDQAVAVHSQKAKNFQTEGKKRLVIAEGWLQSAKKESAALDAKLIIIGGFPTAQEFNDAVSQKDWDRLERLLARAEEAGAMDPQEQKQVEVFRKVLEEARRQEARQHKKKRRFDLG